MKTLKTKDIDPFFSIRCSSQGPILRLLSSETAESGVHHNISFLATEEMLATFQIHWPPNPPQFLEHHEMAGGSSPACCPD